MPLKPVEPPIKCPTCKNGILFSVEQSKLATAMSIETYQCSNSECNARYSIKRSEGEPEFSRN